MDAVQFMCDWGRMCEHYRSHGCEGCEMSLKQNGTELPCMKFAKQRPLAAVKIVSHWAVKHPIKTLKMVLLEKMPEANIEDGNICPGDLWKRYRDETEKCDGNCIGCWNRPAPEDLK